MAIILGVVFGVGMLQEGFQAFNQGTFSLEASLTDLMVDLTGGLLALLFYGLVAMKSRAY